MWEDHRQEEGQHQQDRLARPVINGEDGVIFMGLFIAKYTEWQVRVVDAVPPRTSFERVLFLIERTQK